MVLFKKEQRVLIAYASAMIFLCINNILVIVDISLELTGQRGPEFIHPTKSSVGALNSGYIGVNTAFFITPILSFYSTWFATVLLLQHYSTQKEGQNTGLL